MLILYLNYIYYIRYAFIIFIFIVIVLDDGVVTIYYIVSNINIKMKNETPLQIIQPTTTTKRKQMDKK